MFGAEKLRDTKALRRGRELESLVLKKVESETKIKFEKCGLHLSSDLPVFGASPDGISTEYVLEIKCPYSKKSTLKYIDGHGRITERYKAQVQLQMHFSKRKTCYFAVASHDFELSKKISLISVPYDGDYVKSYVDKAVSFWKESVWPILMSM